MPTFGAKEDHGQHPAAVQGLSGQHAIVCAIEDFPAQIARLLRDHGLRATLGTQGRRLVEETYDWGTITDGMRGVIESALARRHLG